MDNRFGIVTGASSGIGLELARIAAAEDYDLLLVADTPFTQMPEGFGRIEVLEQDLSTIEGVNILLEKAAGRRIDLLIANAGQGHGGAFLDQDLPGWLKVIGTNIIGTTYLVGEVLRGMVARQSGKILVTGSIAGLVPGSYNAVYNATKAYVNNLLAGLRGELNDQDLDGITLTTLMPGATDTAFFHRAEMDDTKVGTMTKDDPADVARTGWDALMAGKHDAVHGIKSKLQAAGSHLAPESVLAAAHTAQAKPGTAD